MDYSKNYKNSSKDNHPIFVIENKSDSWLGDVLIEYNVKVVYGFHNINANHKCRAEPVTPKLVRDILRDKKLCFNYINGPLSSLNRNEIIVKLLRFVLRDKAYDDLTGVPLVPVLNNSHTAFGDKTYYLTKRSERRLFPKHGPNVFVDDIEDQDIIEIFLSKDFQKYSNIKFFDLNDFKKILKHELPKQSSLDWNPESSSIPNKYWLNSIWEHIFNSDCDLELFAKYPLLPVDKPASPDFATEKLVALNSSNPLIRHPLNSNHEPMVFILEKLGVHFTKFRKVEKLKQYILDWSPQNVLLIVEKVQKLKDMPMDKFLGLLDSEDKESFRRFIIDNWFDFLNTQNTQGKEVQKKFYNIIRLLPIWPTHSKDKIYMPPKNGCLLPKGLVYYSPLKTDSNYFDVESEDEWLILNKLDVPVISFSSYTTNLFYQISRVNPSDPGYMNFLCSLLKLPLYMIPESLERFNFIPNDSYTKLMKVKELYDPREELFREVFAGSDHFLPPELRNGWVLDGLTKLGLNRGTDSATFIRVAEEIEKLSQMPSPPENLRDRAKVVVRHFYYYVNELNLSSEAWEKLSKIKFVPTKPVEPPFLETAYSKVAELHSFNSICLPKYRNVCWTQCAIYDDDILPHSNVYELFPEVGQVNAQVVINHLYTIIKDIVRANLSKWKESKWKESGMTQLLHTVFYQIYQRLDEDRDPMLKSYLRVKLKVDPKIFLNGEDPFDAYNWVSAKQLVLNIDDDINSGNRAVCTHLALCKRLLRICEAQEMKNPRIHMQVPDTYSQRGTIARSFARFLDEQSNSISRSSRRERDGIQKFHDIFFHVQGEIIGSNRYVLAASANYFERMFTSGTKESNPLEPVHVNVDDIKPETFRMMLKWLYGRSLEDVLSELPQIPDDEISFYLETYIDLLNACEKYDLQELKRLIEHKIVKSDLIRAQNVLEVKKWAEKYNAMQLFSYCKDFKKENLALLVRHRCVDLLHVDGDELSDALDSYEDEFGSIESSEEENNFWNWRADAEFNEFEKNCSWYNKT